MTMDTYAKGQTVDLGPEYLRDGDGNLTTATAVTVTVRKPDGTAATPGSVTIPTIGEHHCLVTADQGPGIWSYQWDFTVSGSHALHRGRFYVEGALGDTPEQTMLTSVDAVKDFAQITDTAQDPIIWQLIRRASAAIMAYPGVPQFRPTRTGSYAFIHSGGTQLDLSPYALRAATSVQIDTDTTSPTDLVEETDYHLRPEPPVEGVYTSLRVPSLGELDTRRSTSRSIEREITVTGDWGYQTIPYDVEHAAIVTVTEWLRRHVQAFGTTLNTEAGILDRPEAIPHSVRAVLRRYRSVIAP